MKKIMLVVLSGIAFLPCSSQNNNLFIRHDTTLLKAEECHWLVPKDIPGASAGKSVSAIIIDAIVAGKLKVTDLVTGETIPADKFLTWHQPVDSVMTWDEKKQENVMKVIQQTLKPEHISRIRIYHDWFLNTASGKLETVLGPVDLMRDIYSPTGTLRGYMPLCRLE